MVATRCRILTNNTPNSIFGRGSAPDLSGGAYGASPDPLAGLKGSVLLRKGHKGLQHEAQLGLNLALGTVHLVCVCVQARHVERRRRVQPAVQLKPKSSTSDHVIQVSHPEREVGVLSAIADAITGGRR